MNIKRLLIFYVIMLMVLSCSSNQSHLAEARHISSLNTPANNDCVLSIKKIIAGQGDEPQRQILESSFKTLDYIERSEILRIVDSLFYIDYEHSAKELFHIFRGKLNLRKAKFPYKYNDFKWGISYQRASRDEGFFRKVFRILTLKGLSFNKSKDALENSIKARRFLTVKRPAYSLDTIRDVHKIIMDDNIANLSDSELGRIRRKNVTGAADIPKYFLTSEKIRNIDNNPYLTFKQTDFDEGQIIGKIIYPSAMDSTDETIELIKKSHPRVYEDIRALREKYQLDPSLVSIEKQYVANTNLVTALMEDTLAWFVRERDQLGEIDSVYKFIQFSNLVSKLHRNMISIHPFNDGNGRTVREFALYYSFLKEGFPPPRLIETFDDINSSPEEWAEQVLRGVIATDSLYRDLITRVQAGLDIEGSPEIFSPYILREAYLRKLKEGSTIIKEDYDIVEVDNKQFAAFFKLYTQNIKMKEIERRLTKEPEKFFGEVYYSFLTFTQRNHAFYDHNKMGIHKVGLNLVDDDFVKMFHVRTIYNPDLWKRKMDMWYTEDLLWRGLSSQHRETSEDEIFSMFKSYHPQFISMGANARLSKHGYSNSNVVRYAVEQMQRYNRDLYEDSGQLVKVSYDHMTEGPLYRESYGYSTSKDEKVGIRYARGWEVLGTSGDVVYSPEQQSKLKSRIVVAVRRSHKDVDLTRLKRLRPDFSNEHGRQQEVMGIGAADPDSLMVVKSIDPKGNIEFSYVRDENSPSVVWQIVGDYNTTQEAVNAGAEVIKKIELSSD